ncbi:anaerobic ribonucleoside-triphosphate reductase activating protein [Colwellia sp. Bg11-28]|uniref:anaerobic ribonucleoside-triphosphate reductase activating protein n=1 Tax=Colwellia sp. Bg11-28 TaxID=2058305 RepID=UPI000C34E83B|nr:anaerobic ribonucleoside-triphosphate reductase activating protein [Colwellia sp. Bg11-28]PKH88249.1 anaerobic ribonucleoside-triphosphate reductase activating protein [Colwellia sp. Bg11-28]
MNFNCITPSVVFQEVPNEISLCFSITGCKVGCKGCHSTELWHEDNGIPLSNTSFTQWLKKYQGLISCVVFFGGEWQPNALIEKLLIAKNHGLKTCLYSGEKHINIIISQHLNFLKTGAWHETLGGLDSPTTNQVFRDVISGKKLNHLFNKAIDVNTFKVNTVDASHSQTTILETNSFKTNSLEISAFKVSTFEPYQFTQGANNVAA